MNWVLFGRLLRIVPLAVLLVPVTVHAAPENEGLRRFVIVASANDGGPGRPRLRFADSDAAAVAAVLRQLGGVRDQDVVAVAGATRVSFQKAFLQVRDLLAESRRPGLRAELVVYYSGHSDEDGLLLGGDRIPYADLRRSIEDLGADVRIAVLDSCASGALLRLKGGVRRPSFLVDASSRARGHAFLTASSADEAAQESDRIGAAFFTHYLVSGLRGAADSSHDGRVTLSEAYQYAFHETLRRTQASSAGAQHAAYDIQLQGTGDLVMTDLRSTTSRLIIDSPVTGRLYVRDGRGRLLVEVRKEPGYPVELGLEPGVYQVALDRDGRPFETSVTVSEGGRASLDVDSFQPVAVLSVATRGGNTSNTIAAAGPPAPTYKHVGFDLMLAPGIRSSGPSAQPIEHGFVLGLVNESDRLRGAQFGLGANIVRDEMHGAQFSPGVNLVYGRSRGAQFSGLANVSTASFHGLQMSGLANLAWSDLRGAQFGNLNLIKGRLDGAQFGVVNLAHDGRGAQFAVVNLTRGRFSGAQIGVVNIGGTNLGGAQIGVLNIASEFTGTQVGVVNIARKGQGESIGLLPLVGDGYHRLAIWGSDVTAANLAVKLGARHVYTLLGGGVTGGDREIDRRIWSVHAGFGGHIQPEGSRVFLDIDFVSTARATGSRWLSQNQALGSLRLLPGFQLRQHLAVFAGPTLNVSVAWNNEDPRPGFGVGEKVIRDGESTTRIFPGFVAGIQM